MLARIIFYIVFWIGYLSAQAIAAGIFLNATPIGPTGMPQNVVVLPNGWQAQIDTKLSCANVTSAYSLTPDATPKVVFTVTSPGYTSTGAVTTISRNVYGTIWLRQVTPNNTLPNESSFTSGSNTGCRLTLVLSDFIHTGDTAYVTFLGGFYTSGSATLAAVLPVVNKSTSVHPKPICNWVTENRLPIESTGGIVVEVACFHARPQQGNQVAAVIFTAADSGAAHTATCTSSSMTQSTRITAGNPVYVYSCTFGAVFSSFTAGNGTIDFTVYPFVGNTTLTASAGQDGVTIAATTRTANLKALSVVFDNANAHAPAYAWVQTGGTCATNACVSLSSIDPGTGNSANYANIYTASNNCQSYNNANRSHNDLSGCVIEVRAATWDGYGTSDLSTRTPGLTWLTIKGAPGTTNATVVISTHSNTNTIPDRVKFIGIGFTQFDATSSNYNSNIKGGDSASQKPANYEIVCDGCAFTSTAGGWPLVYQVNMASYYNSTINEAAGEANVTQGFGAPAYSPNFYGNTITGPSGALGLQMYTTLGNVMTKTREIINFGSANYLAPTGIVNAFNKIMNATLPMDINDGSGNATDGMTANWADVQNVYEKTTVDAGVSARILGDSDISPLTNFVMQYNTFAGGRINFMYNDIGSACITKQAVRLYTVIDPMAAQGFNLKRDTFATTSPTRICDWTVSHGVGSIGNIANQAADGTSTPSSTSWLGEYFGLTGSTTANNVGYGKSVTFTSNLSASGTNAGSGTYSVTGGSGSPAYGRVPIGYSGLPFDIAGSARRNDGTGCAGAYEC